MTSTTAQTGAPPQPASTPHPAAESGRLMSVDALRGFDMFWIIGAGAIVQALEQMHDNAVTRFFSTQLKHVQWEGFRFYDLIFPLFLFIVGVAMVFSLDKALAAGGRGRALMRVSRRAALLYALGVFYYGGLSRPWPDVALGGVLQRIALCYLFAALIYCFVRNGRGLVAIGAALLVGYWALLTFVPFPDLKLERAAVEQIAAKIGSKSPFAIAAAVPDRVNGVYEEGRNLTNFLDFLFLPGKKAQAYYINEGLLSTLPAIALPLFGALAGLLLKNRAAAPQQKIRWLIAAGVAGIALGLLWSLQFPIIKRIWTSSFILLTAGLSAVLLAVFYHVIEVRGWRRWCQPFVWVGCNAITIYLVAQIVKFSTVAERLVGGDVKNFLDLQVAQGFGSLVVALLGLALALWLTRFLHQRKIFLRV